MTTIQIIPDYLCGVCEGKTEQRIIGSTNYLGASDLDGRPPEMARSTMPLWVQICPHCGYCAENIAVADDTVRRLGSSPDYRSQRHHPNYPELANRFLCCALIQKASRNFLGAARKSLFAAWSCDDEQLPESAQACRCQVLDLVAQASAKEWLDRRNAFETVALVDIARRAGRFSQALQFLQTEKPEDKSGLTPTLLQFEKKLIEAQDTECHTTEDATGPAVRVTELHEILDYIRHNYLSLLHETEEEALFTKGFRNGQQYRWMIDSSTVQLLLQNGIDQFAQNLSERLANDHPTKFRLNRCPKCNALARTPTARQCRFCRFDWHEQP